MSCTDYYLSVVRSMSLSGWRYGERERTDRHGSRLVLGNHNPENGRPLIQTVHQIPFLLDRPDTIPGSIDRCRSALPSHSDLSQHLRAHLPFPALVASPIIRRVLSGECRSFMVGVAAAKNTHSRFASCLACRQSKDVAAALQAVCRAAVRSHPLICPRRAHPLTYICVRSVHFHSSAHAFTNVDNSRIIQSAHRDIIHIIP